MARCCTRPLALLVVLCAAATACASGEGRNLREPAAGQTAPPLATTTSGPPATSQPGGGRLLLLLTPTMQPEGPMPPQHTCAGAGVSPPLSWAGVPDDAVGLAIVAEELEETTTVRWLVAGLDPAITGVAEGRLPAGAVGAGGATPTWEAPCPPEGEERTLIFTLYVLGEPVDLAAAASMDEALEVVQLSSIEQAAATTLVRGQPPSTAAPG